VSRIEAHGAVEQVGHGVQQQERTHGQHEGRGSFGEHQSIAQESALPAASAP
jgi:hypothetical protein